MLLFLDDNKDRADRFLTLYPEATWVQTAEDCISAIRVSTDLWTTIYLDHDLGGEVYVNSDREDCGME